MTPETVLGIYEVIMEEVNRLNMAIRHFQKQHQDGMPVLGRDPVSSPAAKGFNDATAILLQKCQADVNSLAAVGDQLAQAARSYGKADSEIAASLDAAVAVANDPAAVGDPR